MVSMNRRRLGTVSRVRWCVIVLVVTLSVCLSNAVSAQSDSDTIVLAKHLLEKVGITQGLCSMLGCGDGQLAREIVRSSELIIHVLDPDPAAVTVAREACDMDGPYGTRLIIEKGSFNRLPYGDNTVDLVIMASLTDLTVRELSLPDIMRVLRPGGKAILGVYQLASASGSKATADGLTTWLQNAAIEACAVSGDPTGAWVELQKPRLAGTDAWSHWQHSPDNNAVSTDTIIKAPYRTQWFGKPYYIAMPAITTAAGGRIFTAVGHIAHHEREEAWLNTLLARNGYNGIELWSRKLPDGYLVHRSAFIATEDVFYMIDGDGCLMLDPETGKEKDKIHIPEVNGEWKWIALQNGVLFVLAGTEKDRSETTIVRTPLVHWSWGDLSRGYYEKTVPWGFGRTIVAYDVDQRKALWRHDEDKPIDSRTMVVGGDKVFYYCPDSHIRCLDAKSGSAVWTNSDAATVKLIEEPGRDLESTPGFKTSCRSLYTPDVLFFETQTMMNIVALSSKDGSLLWSRKKTTNNPNMLYADGHLVVGIGPEGSTLVLDPLTGKTIEDLGFKKQGCTRLTGSPNSFFCRSSVADGVTRYDRATKRVFHNSAVRPGCNDGVIPANGLLYIGPWLCDCNLSLMGTVAMCSAGDFKTDQEDPVTRRLEVGEGDISNVEAFDITDKDWVTYRANNNHNACSTATVPGKPVRQWIYIEKTPFAPSAPSAAGGLVFSCGDDGKVRAIDTATGKLRWCFKTAGPIMRPPTIWNGRAYVGSGDGYIYALEAATGRLLWRFRAAPVERRIMVYGSLCSNWPVNSGILVQDGVAYAAAGIIDYDGTYVYALDAITGKLKWRNNTSGQLDKELRKGVSAQGSLAIAGNRLWMAGGNVVSPVAYDLRTGECLSESLGRGANDGEEIGVLEDQYLVFGGRGQYSAIENYVNPGYFVVSKLLDDKVSGPVLMGFGKIPPAWSSEMIVFANGPHTVPECVEMNHIEQYVRKVSPLPDQAKLAQFKELKRLWTANDLVDTSAAAVTFRTNDCDPVAFAIAENAVLVVYETPRARWRFSQWFVAALDPQSGKIIWKQEVPLRVLPGGLLVTGDGSVVVTLDNGGVVCFG